MYTQLYKNKTNIIPITHLRYFDDKGHLRFLQGVLDGPWKTRWEGQNIKFLKGLTVIRVLHLASAIDNLTSIILALIVTKYYSNIFKLFRQMVEDGERRLC